MDETEEASRRIALIGCGLFAFFTESMLAVLVATLIGSGWDWFLLIPFVLMLLCLGTSEGFYRVYQIHQRRSENNP